MADTAAAPKPSSSVKLVLLGEAAVGKVCCAVHHPVPSVPPHNDTFQVPFQPAGGTAHFYIA